ncbi:hypothetical protein GO290_01931 [Ralstonia solanacearum]|nr:hypothetical protein [Ralstonia solanacearum]
MIRHPKNTNLILHYDNTYHGLSVQTEKGPLISKYLESLYQVISRALRDYSRVFAFRVDLRLPVDLELPDYAYTNEVIERFLGSVKAKIKNNRRRARQVNPYSHDSAVRYVWAREEGQHGRPHYHLAFLLNYEAFCSLGIFVAGRDNMFNRLQEAWASALDLSVEAVRGLVEIPINPCYRLKRGDDESLANFFFRASYLCKAATKVYGDGLHGFGASRI